MIEPMVDLIGILGECRACWDGADKRVGFRYLALNLCLRHSHQSQREDPDSRDQGGCGAPL